MRKETFTYSQVSNFPREDNLTFFMEYVCRT
jgi:hypothetical protein